MESTRSEKAVELHESKYNCAQSVACVFADDFGYNASDMFKSMEAFGRGLGNMYGPCGALTGACAALGQANSLGMDQRPGNKEQTYDLASAAWERFEQRVGSAVCCDIKGEDAAAPLKSCNDCIRVAVEIVEELVL